MIISEKRSLGLIDNEEEENCSIIRKIRNEFAHNVKASFSDETIISLCDRLHFKAVDSGDVVVPPDASQACQSLGA